jgi:hypothetical protein
MSINELLQEIVKSFNPDRCRIKDKNGTVIKFVKNKMEMKNETKKNIARD